MGYKVYSAGGNTDLKDYAFFKKVFSVNPDVDAPKEAMEDKIFLEFSALASTQISKSPVALGYPYAARAYAPTMRNLTSLFNKICNMSL